VYICKIIKNKINLDLINIDRSISVNKLLLEFSEMNLTDGDMDKLDKYYHSLVNGSFLKVIGISHFYDKNYYDFYFVIEDSSLNWTKKIIMTSNIVDLVLKHKILHYIAIKYYKVWE
jgi:hypothetical protein